ncbi:MAG: polyribonucleotide nucleotidyltransferase [Candidatus Omnitrophica bacterium]|nr:polyribonucleotide nucleotidyltransferase [Candidatus Omnitrophota bacterium]MDD5352829.1 polyribonucleotide nucleotidyltransferase [Candidatus Omnitrophota bacterium]MDD5550428.1 polyribonucleotide nucleotidyltransferase [Candidatus Omnitrophota bacterium]
MTQERVEVLFGGQNIILETGKFANQADGAVTVRYGGTVVLVTACVSKEPREDMSFFPLTVEYQEKTYAAGRIPGGFFKREGRPSENEILTARLIDRPIRPLFPKGFYYDVQVMSIVLSSDGEYDPDVLAVIGASAALTISDIPFHGPIGVIRVIRSNDGFLINPSYKQRQESDLDLVIVGTRKGIVMLEGNARQISEEVILKAIDFGFKNLQATIDLQESLAAKCAKKKMQFDPLLVSEELISKIEDSSLDRIKKICQIGNKEQREEAELIIKKELETELVTEGSEITKEDIILAIEKIVNKQVRASILEKNIRVDSRTLEDIRPITCEVGVLPRTHGSGLFTRGQTQSLSITTLGTRSDEQMIDALEGETFKSFMLHYSFPPFSVGEIKPVRGPGRREIGHGALAEKSLSVVMPAKDKFPYTVRVVSEILESNGSSSMATVCAATLSLMDAGVPISDPVAGVALGLVKENDKYVLLTDINGLEDHHGDMDFKVAGTKAGVTAIQLDLKIECVNLDLLKKALEQSHKARLQILDKMYQVISAPRQNLSDYAPRITSLKIKQEKIGELIGPGGKTIRKIIDSTGATIDIEEDGTVLVASTEAEKSNKAIEMINAIVQELEVGQVFTAKVKRITNFGAFCELPSGKEGLVHISEFSNKFIKSLDNEVKLGDEFKVKVIEIDELGRINLSKKQAE